MSMSQKLNWNFIRPGLAALAMMCSLPVLQAAQNIISNPGLEQGAGTWKVFVPDESKDKGCAFSISSVSPHSGDHCAELKSAEFARFSVGHMMYNGPSPRPGERYRLSFWVRADTDTVARGSPAFVVRMLLFNETGGPLPDAPALFFGLNGRSALQFQAKGVDLSSLGGDLPSVWTQVVCDFEVPANLSIGKVLSPEFSAYYTRGSIYLDDVSLERIEQDVPVVLVPQKSTLKLPDIFSDHVVLQRSESTAVWGTADPGRKVTVSMGKAISAATTSGKDGRWRVSLDLSQCGEGPGELQVSTDDAVVTVRDVLVGDVWIASGQSNMEFKLIQSIGGKEEIAQSTNARLRYFVPERQAVGEPAESLNGRWVLSSPATSGRFSAAAWYFAKSVQASQKIPLGLIDTSWGGTPAEAWISSAGMDENPELKPKKDRILSQRTEEDRAMQAFPGAIKAWLAKYQRQDYATANPAEFASPDVATADWKQVTMPGSLADAGMPDGGVFWLRTQVEIPANRAGTYLPLMLGTPHDFDEVYWNGKKIGETTTDHSTSMNPELTPTTNRRYDVPGNLVNAGTNTLAIRLFSPAGNAGIEARQLTAGWTIPLTAPWFAKVESVFPELPAGALSSYPQRPAWPVMPYYTATYLSNGMVYPLRHLALRGVIWYQGEANVGRAWQYLATFPLLIADWRNLFQRPDLPFYFCQLSNHRPKRSEPGDSEWAEIREAQARALALPNTGMATLIDIGEEEDIHFRNKTDVGQRLAAVALAKTYGQNIPFSGPVFESSEIEQGKLRVYFSHVDGGLKAKALPETYQPKSSFPATKPLVLNSPGSSLQGFAICGEDQKWIWADAKIDGDTVLVWSADIPQPKYVRYAWADNPTCNLYNAAGFPAVPFRSDSFPAFTINRKY
jgi:sialate O-acetylesterase